jgi:hypothetical protein
MERNVAYFKIQLGWTEENRLPQPIIKLRFESGISQMEAGMLTNI